MSPKGLRARVSCSRTVSAPARSRGGGGFPRRPGRSCPCRGSGPVHAAGPARPVSPGKRPARSPAGPRSCRSRTAGTSAPPRRHPDAPHARRPAPSAGRNTTVRHGASPACPAHHTVIAVPSNGPSGTSGGEGPRRGQRSSVVSDAPPSRPAGCQRPQRACPPGAHGCSLEGFACCGCGVVQEVVDELEGFCFQRAVQCLVDLLDASDGGV